MHRGQQSDDPVDLAALNDALTDDTDMVSVMAANSGADGLTP